MIRLSFNVKNPFPFFRKKRTTYFFSVDKKLPVRNKNFQCELNFWQWLPDLFSFNIDTSFTGADHAGPSFSIEVFGLFFSIGIYDSRHWDYETNDWEKQDD